MCRPCHPRLRDTPLGREPPDGQEGAAAHRSSRRGRTAAATLATMPSTKKTGLQAPRTTGDATDGAAQAPAAVQVQPSVEPAPPPATATRQEPRAPHRSGILSRGSGHPRGGSGRQPCRRRRSRKRGGAWEEGEERGGPAAAFLAACRASDEQLRRRRRQGERERAGWTGDGGAAQSGRRGGESVYRSQSIHNSDTNFMILVARGNGKKKVCFQQVGYNTFPHRVH